MKNKNKKYYYLLYGLVILASFFIWEKICLAEPVLKITNIQFESETSVDDDFIEITNTTENKINLNEYKLVKKTSSGTQTSIVSFGDEDSISSGKTYLWASSKNNNFPSEIKANIWRKATISETNGIAIIFENKDKDVIIDCINWGEDESEEEIKDYSGIMISEIYPAPNTKVGEEEFVEIINSTGEEIDFSDYTIKDSKGAKGKISKKEKIGKFIVFYGSFSLNNDSKGDTVFLYDKKDNLIASQKYANGKSAHSFSFDGSSWRWTSSPTPGGENFFDKILSGKLILPKHVYKNTYAYFNVKTDGSAKKFTWNFGDGHKSYKKETKHKYKKTGKFKASLKIRGNGEDKIYEFEVKVEKYDAPKIRIKRIMPNPKGLDKNEWIEIENKSKKKVNLEGWSIATGKDKLINHPIRKDFRIKKGKTKKLTKEICAFTLGNEKTKIELRDPSGKVVQKIKYDRKKDKIAEDEIYEKNDEGWNWVETPSNIENKIKDPLLPLGEGAQRADEGTSATTEENIFIIPNSEIQASLGRYTTSPDWQKKQKNRQKMALSSHDIILSEKLIPQNSRVLGAQSLNLHENFYTFTPPIHNKHWAIIFWENSSSNINYFLNYLLLKITF
ncbi:MAG: hypothetical protein COX29_03440 [Candidatus Moranbacteria bacterium CG23_combo_of_CG06-09_8_20_14_all_35_22]|nr:MAG: hypothetical protein COX29_03440 [Candidatus Moranbacteria bacterium CG23_combo_of_CG06-09_8_20_14_all_35_22]